MFVFRCPTGNQSDNKFYFIIQVFSKRNLSSVSKLDLACNLAIILDNFLVHTVVNDSEEVCCRDSRETYLFTA